MKRPGLLSACGLLLITNVVVLLGVAYNRTSEPDSLVTLTERELALGGDWREENTGMWLRLVTNGVESWRAEGPGWFDRKKLEEIGFDCSVPPDDPKAALFYEKTLPLRRYAVLELDGDAWKAWYLRREKELLHPEPGTYVTSTPEERRKQLELERVSHTRLFIVDVGQDHQALRRRYTDRSRYVVVDALARLRLDRTWDETTKTWKNAYLEGHISEILISEIHVPLDKRKPLDEIREERSRQDPTYRESYRYVHHFPGAPSFEADLVYGRRLEPWVRDVRRLAAPPAPGR